MLPWEQVAVNKVVHEIIMLGFVICISNEIHSTLLHETHGFEPELSAELISIKKRPTRTERTVFK